MRYAKGIMWLDDCRIPFEDTTNPATNPKYRLEGNYKMPEKGQISEGSITQFRSSLNEIDVRGRFTPNLLVCDDMLNDGNVSKSGVYDNSKGETNGFHATSRDIVGKRKDVGGFDDKGTNSRYYDLDKWFDKIIDEIR
jgi:hypothetical protein